MSGEQAFVQVEEGETWIECHQVMQHGGTAAPVTEDEDGGFGHGCASDTATVDQVLDCIHQAVVAGHAARGEQAVEVTNCDLGFQAEKFSKSADGQSVPQADAVAWRQVGHGFDTGISLLPAGGCRGTSDLGV